MTVTVLTRPGCPICDEAIEELRRHLDSRPPGGPVIEVETVDIESDDELFRRYLERIPVIRVGGQTVCEIFFEPDALEAALAGHPRGRG